MNVLHGTVPLCSVKLDLFGLLSEQLLFRTIKKEYTKKNVFLTFLRGYEKKELREEPNVNE